MLQSFLITLREGLEMSLVVVILLAYIKKTGNEQNFKAVWQGTGAGVGVSILGGVALFGFGRNLEGKAEKVFEGVAMMLAALVLSWMIVWMKRHAKYLRNELENRLGEAIQAESVWAIAAIPFFTIVREGLETSLFIFGASKTASPGSTAFGAVAGLLVAILIGRFIYQGTMSINLGKLFNVTGILLVLFAGGLLTHGIHEFQEAGLIPFIVEHVWDVNHIIDENGMIGSFLKGIFGYNSNPSLLEIFVYPAYVIGAMSFFLLPVSSVRKPSS